MRLLSPLLLGAVLQAQGGVFADPEPLQVAELETGSILHADVDGDGLRDLVGGWASVRWHRNGGTDDRPRWGAGRVLRPGGKAFPVPEG